MQGIFGVLALAVTALLAVPVGGYAQQPLPQVKSPAPAKRPVVASQAQHVALTEKLNQNTVTIVSGNPNGTYLYLAYDMSAVLDDGNELRVLPVIGKGGYQNVVDVLHLRGIDLCITQSNIMSYLKKSGEFGSTIDNRLAYIAKLYNEEMHVLGRAGHQDDSGPERQESQLQRCWQRHAVFHAADFRAPQHQGAGDQCRSGRRLPNGEVGRDRGHHSDRWQADRMRLPSSNSSPA